MKWEMFHDISYYDMWAVRPVGMRDFNRTLHFAKREEAEFAVNVLESLTGEILCPREVFAIAGGDTECTPNPTAAEALAVLKDLRECYDTMLGECARTFP